MPFSKFNTLTLLQLESWVAQARTKSGQLPRYVPLLAESDPDKFALALQLDQTHQLIIGDADVPFVLMSVIKPFLLLFLLHHLGQEKVFSRVGFQPSSLAFNSVQQLIDDQGFPRNSMINSGAIALADLLPGTDADSRCEQLRQWLNQQSSSQLRLDQSMLDSVRSLPNSTNRAIAEQLAQAGYLNSVEIALDTYNQICCLSGTITDLARLGQLLAHPHPHLSATHQHTVNTAMLSCGLYETADDYAKRIGLPIKSGVSGGLLVILPDQGVIACYSPQLDQVGHSVVGLAILEQMMQWLRSGDFQS
ncbi:MAG: glutaminase A [Cyanobacteria bacterium RM1_2_2]|nr:glutaminase A [Cyanobacteria bacterium RM1_2_2]